MIVSALSRAFHGRQLRGGFDSGRGLRNGRNVAVEGFAQIVNQTHQHHPLHVQFGPLAGQHGGQQRQPPRVFGGAFVPSFRGVGGAQYVFQPLGFADEAQVSDQFFHDRLRFGFQR